MEKVRLIDVDGHNFPNLPLMKLSAYHKKKGDEVKWYDSLFDWCEPLDKVYMSKIFTFTPDYPHPVVAKQIIKSGTGYFYPDGGNHLSTEIEHIYPDYSIYYDRIPEVKNTAYGFLTRGCPNACEFCIVSKKEGRCSVKVADLKEFWNGQRNIKLLDPNMFACRDWEELSEQLIESKALIDFTQGCDIRSMTLKKIEAIKRMNIKQIHFAWDKYQDKEIVVRKLKMFKELTGWDRRKMTVYVLTNFNTTTDQDLERIYTLRELGFWPYVMIYNKQETKSKDIVRQIQRWVNSRPIWETTPRFDDYK